MRRPQPRQRTPHVDRLSYRLPGGPRPYAAGVERFPYHRRTEMAEIILAAVEERTEHGYPGDRMAALHAAGDWVGDALADALEDALLLTAGAVLTDAGPDGVTRDATTAENIYSGAGPLILIKAADWAEASEDPASIAALGLETAATVAADAGFNRWLDRCRPGREPDIKDLCEAGTVALAQMWPRLPRYTTTELTRWWLGPDPHADQPPGGPEVAWEVIARLLLAAIDAGSGPDGPAPQPTALRQRAADLLADCSREPLFEVVQDALFAAAQWVEIDPQNIMEVAAAVNGVFPRAGELWKAVEADLALAGGWYGELEQVSEPEPLSDVEQAPALTRWMGEKRRDDEGTIEYVAAALAAFTHNEIDGSLAMTTDDDMLDVWATGSAAVRIGPRPHQWPPAARRHLG